VPRQGLRDSQLHPRRFGIPISTKSRYCLQETGVCRSDGAALHLYHHLATKTSPCRLTLTCGGGWVEVGLTWLAIVAEPLLYFTSSSNSRPVSQQSSAIIPLYSPVIHLHQAAARPSTASFAYGPRPIFLLLILCLQDPNICHLTLYYSRCEQQSPKPRPLQHSRRNPSAQPSPSQ
jgi:hypothetical protein